jgi:lysocardiolipin and lysophospholipid acyltransferase
MYWRRFSMSSIPLDDSQAFEEWLKLRWEEKEQILECFIQTGRFPADDAATAEKTKGYIETEVRLVKWYEVGQIFVVLATFGLVVNIVTRLFAMVLLPWGR